MASMLKTTAPDIVLTRLARSLTSAGDKPRALAAYRRVYYEFPLSELSDAARGQILQLAGIDESARLRQDFSLELGRAQRLFGSKRYAESLTAFEALRPLADADNRELVGLRVAEAQFYLGRYKQAIDERASVPQRVAQGGSAVLLALRDARLGRSRELRHRGAPPRRAVPERRLGRGGAEQPRHALHPDRRRRYGDHRVPRLSDAFPGRPLRTARRVESGLGALSPAEVSGRDRRVRAGRGQLSALRLSSAISLLDGAGLRSARKSPTRPRRATR